MSTLCNVEARGDGAVSPSVGLASSSIPEAGNSQKGVSLRYAYNPDKRWWVLRATYGREKLAYEYISHDGLDSEAFYARHWVRKTIRGKLVRILDTLIPGILFVYCTESQINAYVKETPRLSFLRFYYNHCAGDENAMDPPLQIRYEDMMNFISLVSVDDDHIIRVDREYVHYQSGDEVIVTEGKFTGVKGKVARAAGQQRVIVELEGVALIATAYVRSEWIEKL